MHTDNDLCVAGMVETGPGLFQIDFLNPSNHSIFSLRNVKRRDISFFTDGLSSCNSIFYI